MAVLQGTKENIMESDVSVILVAEDLAPSETIQLDKSKVLSFVTRHGSVNSHTAILARTMNIPALICVDFDESINGKMGIVDGFTGRLIIDPDGETIRNYQEKQKFENARKSLLQTLRGKGTVTKNGKKINLFANISSVGDVASVIEQGVMIETPAAVFISEELAKEVDFFSIGTNDLTQYLLAIDRQNPSLDTFYDPHHPAVLRAIRTTVENGHKAGIWVGICGELGADLELTKDFIEMGVDELSVSPSRILEIRSAIRNID